MNLARRIINTLESHPEKVAIREPGGDQVTYNELYRMVAGLSKSLSKLGFVAGESVALQVPNGIALAAATIAVLASGGTVVFCEPGSGDGVYLSRVLSAAPRWVIVHPLVVYINKIPLARRVLRATEVYVPPLIQRHANITSLTVSTTSLRETASSMSSAAEIAVSEVDDSADAVIIFTGGTTKKPKGVRLSHGALEAYLHNIGKVVGELPVDVFLADTPHQLLIGLRMGLTVQLSKGRTRRRAKYVLRLLHHGLIDGYFGSPYLWTEMMKIKRPRTTIHSNLRVVLLGGAPVTAGFLRSLRLWLPKNAQVLIIYGLTEAGPVCVSTAEEKLSWDQTGDFVGKPLPGVKLETASTGRRDVPGELLVFSTALFTGYLGRPPRGRDEPLHTGDLARLVNGQNGPQVVLLGRSKDMIIRDGVNVYPGMFEPALREIVDGNGRRVFRNCALIGVWNEEKQDEDIALCYEVDRQASFNLARVSARVRGITGADAAPDRYVRVQAIPVVGRQNKIDRSSLRRRAEHNGHR